MMEDRKYRIKMENMLKSLSHFIVKLLKKLCKLKQSVRLVSSYGMEYLTRFID